MKICSFVPAGTQMIYSMNLQEHLCGVTFECASDKPKVVRSYLEEENYTSDEIDKLVTLSKKEGKSLYYIDEALLESISPDVIFTQDVCDVCQIDSSTTYRSIHKLKNQPQVVPLIPRTLTDVYANAISIAAAVGKEDSAHRHIEQLQKRISRISEILNRNNAAPRKVMVMEWLDPIYNCGHWIPDQIALAGGYDELSNLGGYSVAIPWEKVRMYDPEVLVIAPCGFTVGRTLTEIQVLFSKEGWNELAAVRNNEVYLADATFFTQPSTTLIDGIELLAALFHPDLFKAPLHMNSHFLAADKVWREK